MRANSVEWKRGSGVKCNEWRKKWRKWECIFDVPPQTLLSDQKADERKLCKEMRKCYANHENVERELKRRCSHSLGDASSVRRRNCIHAEGIYTPLRTGIYIWYIYELREYALFFYEWNAFIFARSTTLVVTKMALISHRNIFLILFFFRIFSSYSLVFLLLLFLIKSSILCISILCVFVCALMRSVERNRLDEVCTKNSNAGETETKRDEKSENKTTKWKTICCRP